MHAFTFLLFFAITSTTESKHDAETDMIFRMVRVRVFVVLSDRKLSTYSHAYIYKICDYECSWILFFPENHTSNTQIDKNRDGILSVNEVMNPVNTAIHAAQRKSGKSVIGS